MKRSPCKFSDRTRTTEPTEEVEAANPKAMETPPGPAHEHIPGKGPLGRNFLVDVWTMTATHVELVVQAADEDEARRKAAASIEVDDEDSIISTIATVQSREHLERRLEWLDGAPDCP